MKILEIICATWLVIFAVTLTIWQIIGKSPAFVIIFFVAISIMAILVLRKVLQEFREERKQKK